MGKFGENQFGTDQFGSRDVITRESDAEVTSTADVTSIRTSRSQDAQTSVTTAVTTSAGASTRTSSVATTATIDTGQIDGTFPRTTNAQATGARIAQDGTPAVDLGTQWRVVRDQTEVETELYNVEITDTANPFGNKAIAFIDDYSGEKFGEYTRGTRVDFEYSLNDGISYNRRFSGYVVEARELDKQGADALEVECYSFDQFLRRDTVTEDLSGKTITEALESIVTNDTPVAWEPANVTVVDDQELTRSYRGELVENVLRSLRSTSGNEAFGVNDDLEFFFAPRETEQAPRNVSNSDWFNYDIPEEGKETLNQVTVFYNDGNSSVTVDDGGDKKELQNNLGTAKPVTLGQEVSRPDITNIEDARAVGEEILNDRETTLTGTVTTFGLETASPGDTISIEIIERGIDGNFEIAELHYNWGQATTQLTIVEKTGNQDVQLARLSDSVQRIETQDADRDAVSNRITSTNVAAELPVSGSANSVSISSAVVTNTLRNALRDKWADGSTITVSEIAVGDGTTSPNRSDTTLQNELERVSVSQSLPDAQSVLFEGSVSETDIREIGLFDSGGDLLVRASVPDSSLTSPVDLDLRIDVENDSSVSSGVVTNTGLTAIRDIIADNSPTTPTDYAYGSDDTTPSITDTALGNELVSTDITELLVQYADTADEWSEIVSLDADEPVKVDTLNNELVMLPVTWFVEAEDANNLAPIYNDTGSLSGDEGRELTQSGEFVEVEITPEYDIPADALDVRTMVNLYSWDGTVNAKFYQDGTNPDNAEVITTTSFSGTSAQNTTTLGFNGVNNNVIEAGETWYYRAEADTINSGSFVVDMMYAVDSRFNINDSPTFDSGTASFNGPEIYPEIYEVQFSTENTRRTLDAASVSQQWNDTSNNQYIELSNDNGNTWIRSNNTENASASFSSAETNLTCRVGMSRWTAESLITPTNGDSGQDITLHIMDANIEAITPSDTGIADVRAIIPPGDLAGDTIREAAQQNLTGDTLTRSVMAGIDVQPSERIISSEKIAFRNP